MDRGIAKRHVRQHWTGNGRRPVMVSVHKDYADFALFYQKFRRDWEWFPSELQDFSG